MDDMLVKSLCTINHLTHLIDMFNVLHTYKMKLNSNKYTLEFSQITFWISWLTKKA